MSQQDYPPQYVLFGGLITAGNRLQIIGDKFYDEVTAKQWSLLACLELQDSKEPPTLGELAQSMGCSHQNTKQLALKLQEKGYIKLKPDAADRRKSRVKRTAKCDALMQKYVEKQSRFMQVLFGGTNSLQLQVTLQVLQTLNQNMQDIQDGTIPL